MSMVQTNKKTTSDSQSSRENSQKESQITHKLIPQSGDCWWRKRRWNGIESAGNAMINICVDCRWDVTGFFPFFACLKIHVSTGENCSAWNKTIVSINLYDLSSIASIDVAAYSIRAHPQNHYLLMSLNFDFGWHWDAIKSNASIAFHINNEEALKVYNVSLMTLMMYQSRRNSIFHAFVWPYKDCTMLYIFSAGNSYLAVSICLHSPLVISLMGSWDEDSVESNEKTNKHFY